MIEFKDLATFDRRKQLTDVQNTIERTAKLLLHINSCQHRSPKLHNSKVIMAYQEMCAEMLIKQMQRHLDYMDIHTKTLDKREAQNIQNEISKIDAEMLALMKIETLTEEQENEEFRLEQSRKKLIKQLKELESNA